MQTQPTGEHTILVVDDDDLFLQYCKRILSDSGMLVDLAGDGLQALEQAQTNSYELILLDVSMPYMDGIKCQQRLKKRSARGAKRANRCLAIPSWLTYRRMQRR